MGRKEESGKKQLIKGSLLYLWEEMKTMNRVKFKALSSIIAGLLKMKFKEKEAKKQQPRKVTHFPQ